jgi:branched-subunit amino acid transport protein AzlD
MGMVADARFYGLTAQLAAKIQQSIEDFTKRERLDSFALQPFLDQSPIDIKALAQDCLMFGSNTYPDSSIDGHYLPPLSNVVYLPGSLSPPEPPTAVTVVEIAKAVPKAAQRIWWQLPKTLIMELTWPTLIVFLMMLICYNLRSAAMLAPQLGVTQLAISIGVIVCALHFGLRSAVLAALLGGVLFNSCFLNEPFDLDMPSIPEVIDLCMNVAMAFTLTRLRPYTKLYMPTAVPVAETLKREAA